MSISQFTSLKVPELKSYLTKRGISVTAILRKNLVNLCEAVQTLNLPVDPGCVSCKGDTSVLLDKIRSAGCPFDHPFTAPGYSTDFSDIPALSLYDIFNYLVNSKADYDKKKLKAYKSCDYRLFIDGHIEELLFNELKSHPVCLFKAKCKPTQRETTYLNKKYYDLWILIDKAHSEVKTAYCTCTGGADGACRHVSAALYEIENFEQKSVTDGENTWAKRPHLHDNPVPVKKLRVVKAKYSSLKHSDDGPSTTSYDPRICSHRNTITQDQIKSFALSLKETGRGVPIIPPSVTIKAMDYLTDEGVRKTAGILEKNNYVFASKGEGVVSGYDALTKASLDADLIVPKTVTCTNLRKYMATITQVLDLKPNEMKWVINHIGHSLEIHKIHYRCTSDALEKTQIAKILLLQDNDRVGEFWGRSLQDIQVEDLIVQESSPSLVETEDNGIGENEPLDDEYEQNKTQKRKKASALSRKSGPQKKKKK